MTAPTQRPAEHAGDFFPGPAILPRQNGGQAGDGGYALDERLDTDHRHGDADEVSPARLWSGCAVGSFGYVRSGPADADAPLERAPRGRRERLELSTAAARAQYCCGAGGGGGVSL